MTLEKAYSDGYLAGANEWAYGPPTDEAEKEAYNKGWAKGREKLKAWDKANGWENN